MATPGNRPRHVPDTSQARSQALPRGGRGAVAAAKGAQMSKCCDMMTKAIKKTLVTFDMSNRPVINMVPDYGGSHIHYATIKFCPWCGTSTERLT